MSLNALIESSLAKTFLSDTLAPGVTLERAADENNAFRPTKADERGPERLRELAKSKLRRGKAPKH